MIYRAASTSASSVKIEDIRRGHEVLQTTTVEDNIINKDINLTLYGIYDDIVTLSVCYWSMENLKKRSMWHIVTINNRATTLQVQ